MFTILFVVSKIFKTTHFHINCLYNFKIEKLFLSIIPQFYDMCKGLLCKLYRLRIPFSAPVSFFYIPSLSMSYIGSSLLNYYFPTYLPCRFALFTPLTIFIHLDSRLLHASPGSRNQKDLNLDMLQLKMDRERLTMLALNWCHCSFAMHEVRAL